MKAAALIFTLAACAAAQLSSVHTVYLLPMSNGMDQYLANRLTETGTFQVLTDPKRADAVITDRVGEVFEQRMTALFPPEPPPAPPKPEPPKEAKKDPATKSDAKEPEAETAPEKKETIEAGLPRSVSFSRAPGNVFLVDVRTRAVLWSTYALPKRMTPDDLTRTAGTIVDRLKKTISGKQ